ncbi:MAG: hypothetical protein ACPHQO_03350 [Candidatus Kariarchaeum pelagius]
MIDNNFYERNLLVSIILYYIYIVLQNIASITNFALLIDTNAWTLIELLLLIFPTFMVLKKNKSQLVLQLLKIAIVLTIGLYYLVLINYSILDFYFSLYIIFIHLLIIYIIQVQPNKYLKLFNIILLFEILTLILRISDLIIYIEFIGFFEELIIFSLVAYYIKSKVNNKIELIIIIISFLMGWLIGDLISIYSDRSFIFTTLFDQLFSLGSYEISSLINSNFFLNLHLGLSLSLISFFIIKKPRLTSCLLILGASDILSPFLILARILIIYKIVILMNKS